MNSINFKINEKITTKKFLLENSFSKRAIKDIFENVLPYLEIPKTGKVEKEDPAGNNSW